MLRPFIKHLSGGCCVQEPHIDLVVSGINRGDNAGLHVIYSGTVGAACEGACKVRAALNRAFCRLKLRTR